MKRRGRMKPWRRSTKRRKPPGNYKSWKSWSRAMRAAKTRRHTKRRKGAGTVARRRRRKLYGAAAAAHARKRGRRSHRHRAARHRRYPSSRRRYRRSSARSASRAGRVLRYRRRNPPLFGGNLIGRVMDGAVDATEVVLGKAVSRAIPHMVGLPQEGAMGLAVQVGAALVAGWLARNISPNASKMVLAGGLAAPIESFIKSMNIPVISAALGDEGYFAVGAYPQALSAYPTGGMAGDEAEGAMYGY